MPPRVSVVVPIYNVGEYLVPCLDAVEQQTLDGLEVILVDDGSSDGSEQVADAYAQRNPGWQVLHVPNGGLGRARNLGSDLATGEFLAFLDSDDVVPRDAYDLLYHVLNETGSDLVSGGVLRYDGAHASVSRLHARALKRTQMRTHVRRTPELLYDTTAWNKLYRRSFLAEHGLRFPEGVYYEDIPLTTPAHFLARSVDVLVDPVYWWRERQTANLSITQRRAETKNLEDRLAAVTSVDDFLTGRGETEGKRHHDTKVLRLDIPIFLDVLHEGDDTFRRRFIELAGAYLARVDPDLLRPLPPVRRLAYHLIQRGLLDELLQALEISRDPRRTTNFVRRGLRTYADLPYLDDERLGVPRSVYDVTRSQPLQTGIADVKWDGDTLVVEGHAFIHRVSLPTPVSAVRRIQLREVGGSGRRVSVSARPMRRLDVSARVTGAPVTYDWSGFRASIEPGKLPTDGTSPDGHSWELVAQLATPGVRRGAHVTGPEDGRALHPPRRLLDDGTLVVPHYRERRLTVTTRRPPALLRGAVIDGAGVHLEIQPLGDVDGAELLLRRVDSLHGVRVPLVVPAGGDGSTLSAYADAATLDVRAERVSRREWEVYLLRAGDEEPGARLPAAPELHDAVGVISGRLVHVRPDEDGFADVVESVPTPVVTTVAWGNDGGLLLRGRTGGTALRGVVLVHSDGTEITMPADVAGEAWTLEMPRLGAPGSGALRTLTPGRWNARAAVGGGHGQLDVPVLMASQAEQALDGMRDIDGIGVAVRARTNHVLGFTVDAGGPWEDRGAYRQRRLRRYAYRADLRRPLEGDTILFESWKGRQFADSPRAIYEELVRRGDPRRMVWAVENLSVEVPDGVETVVRFGRDYYRHLARARWLVSNDSVAPHYVKRSGTTYLQTWHGTPLKRIGFDIDTVQFANKSYLEEFAAEVAKWDYLVSPNSFSTEVMRRAFRYEGEILETGYPRNDVFHRPEDRERRAAAVRRRLGIADDRRVVLYAPTWRDNRYDRRGRYLFDMKLDLEMLHRHLRDDAVVLVRGHQLVAERVGLGLFEGFVRNVSRYPDISDLYLVADVLVTDYSSVMFDFANTGRPMLFYTWDLDEYRDSLRGFYFDFEATAPGPLLRTTDDVVQALESLETVEKEHADRYTAFAERFCAFEDGAAAARVVDAALRA